MPSATTTSVWKRPQRSRSRRAGISVAMIAALACEGACAVTGAGSAIIASSWPHQAGFPFKATICALSRSRAPGGHTLGAVIEATERLTGREIERAYVDKGYRGHDAANPRRVFISGQKRGVFGVIKRELRRRSAIEAVIGHMKTDGHLGRCYLKGRAGDAANAVLTAVGYNLRLILAWLRVLLCLILTALTQAFTTRSVLKSAC